MYLYGYGRKGKERFILVDMGVTFPDMDSSPGVDLIFPDVDWIAERADRLDGIFITHAHEDHVGAVGHLFDWLKAPIYCRKFTAHIAALKMEEHGYDGSDLNREQWSSLGPVKALVCDSTNVFSPIAGRSEATVGPAIVKIVAEA